MTETMKAVRFHEYGPPGVLVVDEIDRPTPGPGQVRIRVEAVAVHPWDTKVRSGMYRETIPMTLPHVPGIDCAGIVDAIGTGVTEVAVGDSVIATARATYAEYAVAVPGDIAPLPAGLDAEQGATLPVGAGTAWTVVNAAAVAPGQRVLVHGGAGGVGMFALQFARAKGAQVIATTSAANSDFVRSLGADSVIDYTTTRFEDVVHDVDAVLDTVGGEMLERSFAVIRRGGVLATVAGRPSEEAASAAGVRAVSVQNKAKGSELREIGALLEAGAVVTEVGAAFALADAAQAHALSETRHGRGRIVLRVG